MSYGKLRLVRARCEATTHAGFRCWNSAIKSYEVTSVFCWIHLAQHLMDKTYKRVTINKNERVAK